MSTTTHFDEFVEREMTLEEWGAMDEDAEGELVDGHLVEDEDVGSLHDVIAAWLGAKLFNWLEGRGGLVGLSDTRFAPTPRRGRKPDLYVYFAGRRPRANGLVRLPPDVMIEVVSPTPRDGRRDRVEKTSEYAAFGVRWYWIVDPAFRTVEVLELNAEGRYQHVLAASSGVMTSIPGLPGLELDLDAMWATGADLPLED